MLREGKEGEGFLATKVCDVRESSSQGANGVRENKRPLEFGQFGFKCVEMVLVSHAGGLVWLRGLWRCQVRSLSDETPFEVFYR